MQMEDLKSIVTRSSSIVGRKAGNEYVLIPVSNNIADMDNVFTLNETGAFLWELIDGKKNVEDLINAMIEEYDVDNETAKADVFVFLDSMKNYLIIE